MAPGILIKADGKMEEVKIGRPKKKINEKQFVKLCGLQCTKEEICAFLDVSDKTLDKWCMETYGKGFSEVFKEKRGLGKISLRRAQFRLAEKSAAMAIFLGKNYLGQTDKEKTEETKEADGFIEALKGEAENVWQE